MTKKLQELFELPEDDLKSLTTPIPEGASEIIESAFSNLEKIEKALPLVKNLDTSDAELDELSDMATSSYKDLLDLGMQVDSRFSAEIFGVAGNMLGHAITARTAKINKKLKQIELQLKKAALDQKISSTTKEIESTPLGEGKMLDRNELLKLLVSKSQEK